MLLGRQSPSDTRVTELLGGVLGPAAIVFFFIIGRTYSRLYILRTWEWDDTFILLAWLGFLEMTVLVALGTAYGAGHHAEYVPVDDILSFIKLTYGGYIGYQLSLCLTKLSILFFYLRLFPGARERAMCWGTVVFVVGFGIPLLLGPTIQCTPPSSVQELATESACEAYIPYIKASAALHTATDGWLIIMVIPVLITLQIPSRQKFALIAVLSLGVFVMIASIARVQTLTKNNTSHDITWDSVTYNIWSAWESSMGLICACAPAMRPLWRQIFPPFMGTSSFGTNSLPYAGTNHKRSKKSLGSRGAVIELTPKSRQITTTITGGASSGSKKENWISSQNESEENIMSRPDGITKDIKYSIRESTTDVESGPSGWMSPTKSDIDSPGYSTRGPYPKRIV